MNSRFRLNFVRNMVFGCTMLARWHFNLYWVRKRFIPLAIKNRHIKYLVVILDEIMYS